LDDPSLYINRELSWLQFNWRVLEEALDERHPLLERVKFLAIFSSNLDEFFMIRVSGLRRQVTGGVLEVHGAERAVHHVVVALHRGLRRELDRRLKAIERRKRAGKASLTTWAQVKRRIRRPGVLIAASLAG